jgi:hypothetical protein
MKCINCGIEFISKRISAKYCSNKCRKLSFLNKKPMNNLEPVEVPVEVPETPVEPAESIEPIIETEKKLEDKQGEKYNENVRTSKLGCSVSDLFPKSDVPRWWCGKHNCWSTGCVCGKRV